MHVLIISRRFMLHSHVFSAAATNFLLLSQGAESLHRCCVQNLTALYISAVLSGEVWNISESGNGTITLPSEGYPTPGGYRGVADTLRYEGYT